MAHPRRGIPDPIKVSEYKRPSAYVYARAVNSGFMHLAITKHITLCQRSIGEPSTSVGLMCPKCVAKAGTRVLTLRRRS